MNSWCPLIEEMSLFAEATYAYWDGYCGPFNDQFKRSAWAPKTTRHALAFQMHSESTNTNWHVKARLQIWRENFLNIVHVTLYFLYYWSKLCPQVHPISCTQMLCNSVLFVNQVADFQFRLQTWMRKTKMHLKYHVSFIFNNGNNIICKLPHTKINIVIEKCVHRNHLQAPGKY